MCFSLLFSTSSVMPIQNTETKFSLPSSFPFYLPLFLILHFRPFWRLQQCLLVGFSLEGIFLFHLLILFSLFLIPLFFFFSLDTLQLKTVGPQPLIKHTNSGSRPKYVKIFQVNTDSHYIHIVETTRFHPLTSFPFPPFSFSYCYAFLERSLSTIGLRCPLFS